MSAFSSSTINPPGAGSRQSARQTRTNPSRTSKTVGRSSFAFGRGSIAEIPATSSVPHGFYPALTHFTDTITALPREFRRHNSLLKEVDAKAWALEENLLQLLKYSSESQPVPHPPHPASIVNGVIREDVIPKELSELSEMSESKNRRLLFDRVRQSLSDLMMTADEKNHVISNANEELDRQIVRLDTVFPYIAGEISEEARLGNLTHWAYSNKNTAKTATNERPRREAVSHRQGMTHALHEAEAASRSEARREAVLARKQRRAQADGDYDDVRGSGARKTNSGKSRGGDTTADQGAAAKRRKVERLLPVEVGTLMERSASSRGESTRVTSKDAVEKKRARAPNASTVARKKTNATSNAGSPLLAPSPLVGTFNGARNAASPGPNTTSRPQSSRTQQVVGANNSRQRPSSSASNRLGQPNSTKPADSKSTPRESTVKNEAAAKADAHRGDFDPESNSTRTLAPVGTRRDDLDTKTDPVEPETAASKTRTSKNATPALGTFAENNQSRSRPTRSTDPAPAKRSHKKTATAAVPAQPAEPSDEESLHEGDDEDEEGEPRYCYCNEISFGEMVACDNDACPREWFHLSCVGLTKPPGKNVKWYCNECKENMRRSRNGR